MPERVKPGRPYGEQMCMCCGSRVVSRVTALVVIAVADAPAPIGCDAIAELSGVSVKGVRRVIDRFSELFTYGSKRHNGRTYKLSHLGGDAAQRIRETLLDVEVSNG